MVDHLANQLTGTLAKWTKSKRGYVMSVDQGTTSTRCIIFDAKGCIVSVSQLSTSRFFRSPAGWSMTRMRSGRIAAA